MKKLIKRGAALLLCLGLACTAMTGCTTSKGAGTKTKNGNETLFKYDGVSVTLKEAWVYAKMKASIDEATYSSYFGENFWTMSVGSDEDGNPMTMEEMEKEQVISQIKQIIVLDKYAEDNKLALTEDEIADCEKYAKAFVADQSGEAILKECGASEEDILKIYKDNALASKSVAELTKDLDTKVSDEEARQSTINRIVFATTKTDDDGKEVDLSAKKKAKAKADAEDALRLIQGGKDFKTVAEKYEYTNYTETFGKGESEEGKKFEKLLPDLKDGELIDQVLECKNGYVVAQLVAYTDKDATANNKESILDEREHTLFSDQYEALTKELEKDWSYKEDVNQELWAECKFQEAAPEATTETAAETDAAAGAQETGDAVTDVLSQEATTEAK